MNLGDIIKKDIIFFNLRAASREEAIEAIIEGMSKAGYVSDTDQYLSAVRERESKGTTGIGYGVAIPHGKSDAVVRPCLAFARLEKPVEWNSFDGKPVHDVFLIGVPTANAGNDHLKILIAISKMLIHDDFREELNHAKTPEEILSLLASINS